MILMLMNGRTWMKDIEWVEKEINKYTTEKVKIIL